MPSDCHSESFTHLGHCLYINLQFITGLLSFGILSSLFTLAVSILIPQTSLMHWLFHFCLLSVPFTTARGYGLSLKATLPLVTWVQVRWLKSWPLALPNFFSHTPLSCSGFTDTWLSQLVDVRYLAVRWTHGCPDWWMFTVLLFDGHMVVPTGESADLAVRWYICQAVFCEWSMVMVWLCDDISANLSSVNGHWWWYGFRDDGSAIGHWKLVKLEFLADDPLTLGVLGPCFPRGVASSLVLDIIIFASGCWSLSAVWRWRSAIWLRHFSIF